MAEEDEVWVQLYIEGQGKIGDVFELQQVPRNIDALKRAVYQARGKYLGHCDAASLFVYKAGTEFPPKEEDKLRPGKPVPKGTTDENPLRVVAPATLAGKNVSFFCPRTLTLIPRMH
jgi:hypothetical protein